MFAVKLTRPSRGIDRRIAGPGRHAAHGIHQAIECGASSIVRQSQNLVVNVADDFEAVSQRAWNRPSTSRSRATAWMMFSQILPGCVPMRSQVLP